MNKKKATVSMRSLSDKYETNSARLGAIADALEAEKREMTDSEKTEVESLKREQEIIRLKMQAVEGEHLRCDIGRNADAILRENLLAGAPVTLQVSREVQTSSALDGTGIIPIQEQEMLKPLRTGLIYDKVGLSIRTGLPAGELRWPRHSKAKASWVGEGEKAEDSQIDFSKLSVKPERFCIAIPLTKEELESSEGIVETVVREEMPQAIADLINEAMFTTSSTYTDTKGQEKEYKVRGVFANADIHHKTLSGAVPSRAELLHMKALVAGSGAKMLCPAWVMTEAMKAQLEDAKVDAGSGRFVCENDTILGYPVFTTPYIGEGKVGFGDWSYQAAGFFGSMDINVDPYTLLRKNATDFVLNGSFATVTLEPKAFVLGEKLGLGLGEGPSIKPLDE